MHDGFLAQGGQGPKRSMGYSSTGENLAVQPWGTSGSQWAGERWQGWLGSLAAQSPRQTHGLGGIAHPGQWPHWICLLERLMLHEGSSFQRVLIACCTDQVCSTIDLGRINGLI